MLVGLLTLQFALSHSDEEFHAKADLVYDEITRRYSTLEAVLTSLAGFHQASDKVSDVQFSTFAQELLNAYPFILSAVSLHNLSDEARAAYESEMQELGYYSFRVSESGNDGSIMRAGSRPEYLVINIIEPLLPQMGHLLGYDIFSNEQLISAVTRASVSGDGSASPTTRLLRREGSVLVFKAVYQGRYSPVTEQERKAMFNGAIALEVSAGSLLEDIIPEQSDLNATLILRDSGTWHVFAYAHPRVYARHGSLWSNNHLDSNTADAARRCTYLLDFARNDQQPDHLSRDALNVA